MKTDEQLAAECARGSDLAFAALYNRYRQPVYLFAVKMLGDADPAKDALQTVFLRIYDHRAQLATIQRIRPWIFTVARNTCLNELRRREVLEELPEDLPSAGTEGPLDSVAREDEARVLASALGRLSMDDREALVLREYENLSYEEIADVTGCTESAVRSRLFKARQRIARILIPILTKG